MALFIGGEWGSAVMRLYLCRASADGAERIDTVTGGGVVACADFEAAFFAAAQPWFDAHGPLPVILAGMIGSNIGWRDSGYVEAPADAGEIAARLTSIRARGIDIHFTPGIRCRNLFGLPDLVRGEEMQVLGFLSHQPPAARLICLPGRHTKWMLTDSSRITTFTTSMYGELNDLLLSHGLLGKGVNCEAWSDDAFHAGLETVDITPGPAFGHAVFATRGRLVLGDHTPDDAAAFLSGVTIGCDVRDMLEALSRCGIDAGEAIILGRGATADRYGLAFGHRQTPYRLIDASSLAVDGLCAVMRDRDSPFLAEGKCRA